MTLPFNAEPPTGRMPHPHRIETTKPRSIPAEVARLTASRLGAERAGEDAFAPYWQVVANEEPDLFD